QQGSNLVAPMTINDVELVGGIEGAESIPFPAGVGYIAYNLYQDYLQDKRIRQAMAYAIDKKTIAETLFQGQVKAVSTEIPYITWPQPEDANPYDYDADKARALLEEAGWTGEQPLGLWYSYTAPITA